jgi:hypothetical protein
MKNSPVNPDFFKATISKPFFLWPKNVTHRKQISVLKFFKGTLYQEKLSKDSTIVLQYINMGENNLSKKLSL